MDNVYVQQEANIAHGRGLFYLVLPGVRATLEDRADGTFTLQTLQADLGYLEGQGTFRKPGLWRVKDVEGSLDPVFQEDGAVLRKKMELFYGKSIVQW